MYDRSTEGVSELSIFYEEPDGLHLVICQSGKEVLRSVLVVLLRGGAIEVTQQGRKYRTTMPLPAISRSSTTRMDPVFVSAPMTAAMQALGMT